MKTLTKAAISAAAVMAITTGTLALTASAAVNEVQYDLPQTNYSARTNEQVITEETSSILTYSVENQTNSGKRIYCVNSAGSKITTNAVVNGSKSSMTSTFYAYDSNYKWCSVYLEDTNGKSTSMTSLRYQNTPNAKSVEAVLSNDQLNGLNKTIKEGFYIFSINDNSSSAAATLSDVRLTVNLKNYNG